MGNESNICCDNTRHEINWFEQQKIEKVRIVAPKEEKTQTSIGFDKEKRQKIWKKQEDPSLNISEIIPNKENRTSIVRSKIFQEETG